MEVGILHSSRMTTHRVIVEKSMSERVAKWEGEKTWLAEPETDLDAAHPDFI